MTIDRKTGLVLEGGGMRGVFTSGVLDYLLDHQIYFPYSIGVSAGACNGLSYFSRQRGRAKLTNIDLLEKYHYIGLKHLWQHHSILNQELMYDEIPNRLLPFDYDTYFGNKSVFEMVTTNCITGKACYLTETEDKTRLVEIAKASSSLPFVCPMVEVDGAPMLDGGIVDSIPVIRSINTGHPFNIIVLTRNFGYRKKENDHKIPHFIYSNYPRLRVVLSRRSKVYNEQLELVEKLERADKALVIRPLRPLQVDRLCNDMSKLTQLYEEGYACAHLALKNLTFNF